MNRGLCMLGDIVHMSSGGTPKKGNQDFWNGDIPWISAKEMTDEYVSDSRFHISEEGLRSGSRIAPKGSVLLLTRGSGLFNRIPLCIADEDVAYNQDVKCIQSKDASIPNDYVFFLLKACDRQISNMIETTGIGAGKLSTDRLLSLPIHLLSGSDRLRVVGFFTAISKKIRLNNRINDYLAA